MTFKFLAAASLLGAALPAQAVTPTAITSLYSTGVDNAGAATTGHGADLHWTFTGGTAYTGGTNGVFPIGPWVGDSATSRWITPSVSASDDQPVTSFTYSTTFSLTGFKAATASFTGNFAADDGVTQVLLNGTAIAVSGGGFTSFKAFTSAGGLFVAGVNTLTFTTLNSGAGPTGLNVDIAGTASAIPDAPTWALLVAGFTLVGTATRRRAKTVAA